MTSMHAEPAIWMRSYGAARRRHRHGFHQVVLPRSGTMELEVDAGLYRAGSGAGLLIPADTAHAFRGLGDNRFAVVDLPAETAPGLFARASRAPLVPVTAPVERHMKTLEARSDPGAWPAGFRHLWSELLLELLADEAVSVAGGDPRFERAAAWVRRHCDRPISPGEVAAAIHVSNAQLARIVHRAVGMPTGQWILRERLDRAAWLLRTTSRPVGAIALDCGFGEHSALTRAFHRVHGCAPSEYRRRCRQARG